ncbi:hypothetical protein F8277_07395 [Bifidobacterium longum subsp. infantis]|nr:hypothetical protein F8277_07395 [Bifidobacterium longum subsp. infantis]MED7619848.1 hypothetical protein [Bifidobacterium longum subsp. infantis]
MPVTNTVSYQSPTVHHSEHHADRTQPTLMRPYAYMPVGSCNTCNVRIRQLNRYFRRTLSISGRACGAVVQRNACAV